MAIYHFEGQVISRSQGRTATASAAYRSCSIVHDERTGITHNFEKKSPDLVASEILLPEGAPQEFADRKTLWNAVEGKEKRQDAQLCREFNISLPRELSEDDNWDLAKRFVQAEFVDRGMIADINFHRGHKSQEEQPHIHVMLTMRDVSPEGFGKKNRDWNDRSLLKAWRESWAKHVNERLQQLGIDMRIDHRTLEAQGIDLEPQNKIGAKTAQEKMARFEQHQAIARENGESILNDPGILLKAITQQQSIFTNQDIARVVNRYTVDEQQFKAVYAKVMAHPELTAIGKGGKGKGRYTTQTMLATEKALVADAVELSTRHGHAINDTVKVEVAKAFNLSTGQSKAFGYLVGSSDMRNLVGIAGSGKSYLLGAVREAHEKQGYRVVGMAMAGKAAENLEQSSGIAARTVASYIAAWDRGDDLLTKKDVLVIDEAGMLGSVQYARLLHEASKHGAKVITAFDSEQLQAISAGAPARACAEYTGQVSLSEVRRQQVDWQQEATVRFSEGKTAIGLSHYDFHDCIHAYATNAQAIKTMLDNWQQVRSSHPDKEQLMLAYTRREVRLLNSSARDILKIDNALSNPHIVTTVSGKREFCEGDRIYFQRNEYKKMDVKNGTIGTIETMKDGSMAVRLDGDEKNQKGRLVQVNLASYNHVDHGYATTIHKSQGSSVDYCHVLASKHFDRHLTYVAMTRHKQGAMLYWSKEDFKNPIAMFEAISRERKKDFTLDYMKQQSEAEKAEVDIKSQDEQARSIEAREDNAMPPQDIAERMRLAEERLERRAFQNQLSKIGEKNGLCLSSDLQQGDNGIYIGRVTIDKTVYAVIEMEKGIAKVMPYSDLDAKPKKHDNITIEPGKTGYSNDGLVGKCEKQEKTVETSKNMNRQQGMEKTRRSCREIEMGDR